MRDELQEQKQATADALIDNPEFDRHVSAHGGHGMRAFVGKPYLVIPLFDGDTGDRPTAGETVTAIHEWYCRLTV